MFSRSVAPPGQVTRTALEPPRPPWRTPLPPWRTPLPGPPLSSGPRRRPPHPRPGHSCQGSCPQHTGPEPRGTHCAHTLPAPATRGARLRGASLLLPKMTLWLGALSLPGRLTDMSRASTASRMAGITAEGAQVTQCKPSPHQLQAPHGPRTPSLGVLIRQAGTDRTVPAIWWPTEQVLARDAGACPRGRHTRLTSPWSLTRGPALGVDTLDSPPSGPWLGGLPSGTTH